MRGADERTGRGGGGKITTGAVDVDESPRLHRRMPLKFFSSVLTFILKSFLFKTRVWTLQEM